MPSQTTETRMMDTPPRRRGPLRPRTVALLLMLLAAGQTLLVADAPPAPVDDGIGRDLAARWR
jgi:hypothetical protein